MTDNENKELNEPYKEWKDQQDVSELIDKYDIEHPIYLILESDEPEPKGSVSAPPNYTKKLRRNLRKMNKADKLRYLEVMEDIFHKAKKWDKVCRVMKVGRDKTTYYKKRREFEQEYERKPNSREHEEIYEAAIKAVELHTDEYKKLKKRVFELFEKLSDKNLLENDNEENPDQANSNDSPLDKVKKIEVARERDGINSYDEAIDLVEKETGERPFKDYNSFKGVRHRFKEFL